MEDQKVEQVKREVNYIESSFKMKFETKEGLAAGLSFLDDTINEWTDGGKLTYRKAKIDIDSENLHVDVIMRIDNPNEEEVKDMDV